MGDAFSKRSSSTSSKVVNNQVAQQGQTNINQKTGDIQIDNRNGGGGVTVDLSTSDKEFTLKALERVGQSSNEALLATLIGSNQIVNRAIDTVESASPTVSDSRKQLVLAGSALVAIWLIKNK